MHNELLRHTVATIQYRFNKSVQSAPIGYSAFTLGSGSRTPLQIVNHMCDLLDFTIHFVRDGTQVTELHAMEDFEQVIERFEVLVDQFDDVLSQREILTKTAKRLIQGPLSDALTHVGQLAMLSRVAGHPIPYENFSTARINVREDD